MPGCHIQLTMYITHPQFGETGGLIVYMSYWKFLANLIRDLACAEFKLHGFSKILISTFGRKGYKTIKQ